VVLARVRTQLTLQAQAQRLRSLAMLDGLTGVANRRHFDVSLLREWRQSVRSRTPLALLLIDIDFFKRYNDHYGHHAGDTCIQAVANVLQQCLHRPHDLLARYGGEEFACILPDTPLSGALHMARELELAVRALALPHEKSDVTTVVTVSIGGAVASHGGDTAELIKAADRLLYSAKHAGRGQVQCGDAADCVR
jgi:diguanylate cyclase (GGDEF)-like protein